MIINTDQVKSVLDSKLTAPQIAEESGLKPRNINNYRQGLADFENMNLKYLAGLQKFYNNHKEDTPMEQLKITGIRKAVGDFNNWQGAARVYFDPTDMSVETYVYEGPGSYEEFDDPKIVEIAQKATTRMDECNDRITMRRIRETVADRITQ
jgi:hypothetical protein